MTNPILRWLIATLISAKKNALITTVKNGLDTSITIDTEKDYIYIIISNKEGGDHDVC